MATSRRDVTMVVRARDEASRAFEGVAAALEALLGANDKVSTSATRTGNRLQDLANFAANLDKAYAKITGAADTAAAAFDRQAATLTEQQNKLAALKTQAEATSRAMQATQVAIVDRVLAGGDTGDLVAQLRGAAAESGRLEGEVSKLTASVAAQSAALDGQRSALQQIGSTALAADEAQQRLRRTIEQETEALRAQTAVAERNARVLQTIEEATGVTRDRSGLDDLRAQIDAQNEYIATLKARQAAETQQAELQEAQRRAATFLPGGSATGKSARDSAAAFMEAEAKAAKELETNAKKAAAAQLEMDSAAAKLRADLDPMAAIQDRLNFELAEAQKLYKAGKITATEYSGAVKLLEANAKRAGEAINSGKPTPFGLTPWAFQNFTFQINDIATQLASGTSLAQTLAQQGGQIIQIFPRVGAAIAAGFTSPPILAVVAAVGALVLALNEAQRQASLLRNFEGFLLASADAAAYQAKELAAATDQLDRYGLTAKEAVSIVRTFIKEGVNPERLVEFGEAAKDMADVLGIDVADAAKQTAEAFTGGYAAIKKLDDATNFLTATQRNHIKALFDEGKAQQGRAEAFRIFSDRMEIGADKMRGPWSEAARSLGNAWDAMIKSIAKAPVIRESADALDTLGKRLASIFNRMSGSTTMEDLANDIVYYQGKIDELRDQQANSARLGLPDAGLQLQIDQFTKKIQTLRDEQKKLQAAAAPATGDTRNNNLRELELKQTTDLIAKTKELGVKDEERTATQRIAAAETKARAEAERDLADDAYKFATEATKAEYTRQKVAQARAEVEKQITEEQKRQAREMQSSLNQSIALLKEREGFRSKAYWDKNAFRVGYGSDTTTDDAGVVRRVTSSTTVDEVGALRDLTRRIGEFQNTIKEQIGSDRFNAFSPQQQAALTSIAYNYGSLPDRILGAVRTGTAAEIATAVRGLGGDNGGINRARRNREAGIIEDTPNFALEADTAKLERERLAVQAQFNRGLEDELEKRSLASQSLIEQRGLVGEALIAKEREQFIAAEVLRKQQEFDRINEKRRADNLQEIEFSENHRTAVAQLAGAYYDLANAKRVAAAKLEAQQNPVSDLEAQRETIDRQIDVLQRQGDQAAVGGLQAQLADVNLKLQEAQQNLIAFWEGVLAGELGGPAAFNMTAQGIQNVIDRLRLAKTEQQALGSQFLMTGKQINESFAGRAAGALDTFAESVADGKNVFKSFRDAFLQFAADFLREIAQMILKQLIFNAIGGATGNGSGGLGGGIAGFVGGLFHEGGVVGRSGAERLVDASWFRNAVRYHTGGIVGLKPNEVPSVLERGEEVLTRDDPRHIDNGGGAGGAVNLKNVILFDPAEALAAALQTKVGEKVLLTFVQEKAGAFQQAIQGA